MKVNLTERERHELEWGVIKEIEHLTERILDNANFEHPEEIKGEKQMCDSLQSLVSARAKLIRAKEIED